MPLVNRTFDQLIDFTRTSAATFVNSSGNIAVTPQSRNLLTFTQEFNNAAWTKTSCQIVPNVDPAAGSLGPELVTNGDFSSGTGWTVAPGGTGSITGGQAVITDSGAASNVLLRQNVATVAGRLYRITYDVVSTNQSTAAYLGSVLGAVIAGTGIRTFYLVAAASNVNLEIVCQTVNGIVTIDNVSVREVVGGALLAPDGTSTADTLIDDGTSSRHSFSQTATITASATYTTSVYVKAGTGRYFTLSVSRAAAGSVYYAARYDLQTATVTATGVGGGGGTHTASSITAVGNGWYRCVLTGVLSTFTDAVVMASGAANSTGFGDRGAEVYTGTGSTWFLWGFQFEAASAATDYTRNFGGLFPPRFDYDPVTRAPRGLLIEEQRTNLCIRSEEFDNVNWAKARSSITANATTSPDGTVDADKLVEDTSATNSHLTNQNVVVTPGSTYTFSVYLKAAERTFSQVRYENEFSTEYFAVNVNLTTGAFTTGTFGTPTGTAASVTNAGNGWWRVTVTATALDTRFKCIIYTQEVFGFNNYTGNGTSGIYLWGAQLEAGAFATSYIPTVASQVTRSADLAQISAPNFAPWYNSTAGAFVAEFDTTVLRVGSTTVYNVVSADAGTNANQIGLYNYANFVGGRVNTGSVGQADINGGGSPANNVTIKAGIAYASNDVAVTVNGATPGTDTSVTLPTVDRLSIGQVGSANLLNGHIRSIRYYPTKLSNAQLQALTA